MISPIGNSVINEVLRELKLSNEQDALINRQQANDQFDQRIAELRGQVQILKDQAAKIGGFGIFNFVINLFTTALSAVAGFLAPMASKAAQTAVKIIGIVKDALGTLQQFLNTIAEKDKVNSQAKIKESEVSAEIFEKLYNESHAKEQEADKRADEVLQTMREVRRETAEAHSSMAKI